MAYALSTAAFSGDLPGGASAGESSVSVGESRVSSGQATTVMVSPALAGEELLSRPQVADLPVVRSLISKVAQLTILRSANSLLDYFNLDDAKFLGELSITWWRELGCWALVKGSKGHAIVGDVYTFIPSPEADVEKALKELRKARPLDDWERASADMQQFATGIYEQIASRRS